MEVWRKAALFDPCKAGVSTWVFTIARNLSVDDDDQDSANTLADVLRLAGHDCIAAYDGKSALGEARGFHVDVVILDRQMPEWAGRRSRRTHVP